MINENGISNILIDVDFLDSEFKAMGKNIDLSAAFAEIRVVCPSPKNLSKTYP